jgi:hypothetical protein
MTVLGALAILALIGIAYMTAAWLIAANPTRPAPEDAAQEAVQAGAMTVNEARAMMGRPLILEAGRPVILEDCQFLEARRFSREEIARAFAVPPQLLTPDSTVGLIRPEDMRDLEQFAKTFMEALEGLGRALRPAAAAMENLGTAYAIAGPGAFATLSMEELAARDSSLDRIFVRSARWTGRGWGDPDTGVLARIIWMVPVTFHLIRAHGFTAHGAAHYARSLWDGQVADLREGFMRADEWLGPMEALAQDQQYWEEG